MAWTSADLLTDIRVHAMLPTSAQTATDDTTLLAHADKEIQTRLVPMLASVREEWFSRVVTVPLSLVSANNGEWRIPSRAIASRVRLVQLVDSTGSVVVNLARLEPSDLGRVGGPNTGATGQPWAYYLRGPNLVFLPVPSASSSYSLRLTYLERPGRLVAVGSTTAVQYTSYSVATATQVVGVTASSSFAAGAQVDIISGGSPFEVLASGWINGSHGVPTTLTLNAPTTPAGVSIGFNPNAMGGDLMGGPMPWAALADTTPLIPLPVELHGVLVGRVVVSVLGSLGYLDEAREAVKDADEMTREAMKLLAPRTEGEARKLVGSLAWRGRRGMLGWGW